MFGKYLVLLACAIVAQADVEDLELPLRPEPRFAQSRQSASSFQTYAFPAVNIAGYYNSPNYPGTYPTYSVQAVKFTSPAGTVITINCTLGMQDSTNCETDRLQISLDGRTDMTNVPSFCGARKLTGTSVGNSLTTYFYSGGRTNYNTYTFSCLLETRASTATTTAAPVTTTAAVTSAPQTAAGASSSTSTCSCGIRGTGSTKIVGGTTASMNEFPWRVFLTKNPGTTQAFCGGTIIDNSWVLTAAHCTNELTPGSPLYISAGDYDRTTLSETKNVYVQVDRWVQHSSYDSGTQDNDMVLLHLKTPLTFSSSISPICLPFAKQGNNCETANTVVTASGWGTLQSNGSQPTTLQKVDLPCISTAQCRNYKYPSSWITDNMMCTYLPGKDTCQGDSGGSIDYQQNGRYYAIGVVSWGVGCADQSNPGVYAKVYNYLNWIKTTTGATFCQ